MAENGHIFSNGCDRNPDLAALQDLLLYCLIGLSQVSIEAERFGIKLRDINAFIVKAIISTQACMRFDTQQFIELIQQTVILREQFKKKISMTGKNVILSSGPVIFEPGSTMDELIKQGNSAGSIGCFEENKNILSLKRILLLGITDVAANTVHAQSLGWEKDSVYKYIVKGLAAIQRNDLEMDDWVDVLLECGKAATLIMELLDEAQTETFGHPMPIQVPIGNRKGKGILVSGSGLKELEALLKQTKDRGIYVYSHGEMILAHGYPELKKYSHFYGHYGIGGQNQARAFADFPGAILMTTNYLQPSKEAFRQKLFTVGLAQQIGTPHIADMNFQPVINRALAFPGFMNDQVYGKMTVEFVREKMTGLSDKVIDLLKREKIRHLYIVAGCRNLGFNRTFLNEFVNNLPADCIMMTLNCGRFNLFTKNQEKFKSKTRPNEFGQCIDTYSAIQTALSLSTALDADVQNLPLSVIHSWYGQRVVSLLLASAYKGVPSLCLTPALPAFITPTALQFLIKKFNIMPVETPEAAICHTSVS